MTTERTVTPFAKAYPAPWRIQDVEVVDRHGCNVEDFNDDPDEREFWRGVVEAVNRAALAAGAAAADHLCPVCAVPFKVGDTCATDIELGTCHAECLEGSPIVDLETGKPSDGPITTFAYEPDGAHPDEIAVDRFAAAMKAKLAQKRIEGRGGWEDPERCTIAALSLMLIEHVDKGDPVDIANFAMMIHQRGASVRPAPSHPAEVMDTAMVAGWNACRKSIYAVCEDIQQKAGDALEKVNEAGKTAQHEKGFYRGESNAAKSIARGFNAMEALNDDNLLAALGYSTCLR